MSRHERRRRAVAAHHVTIFDAYPHQLGGAQRMMVLAAEQLPTRGWSAAWLVPGGGAVVDELRARGVPTQVVAAPPALSHYGRSTTGLRALRATLALPRYWLRLARSLRGEAGVVHIDDHRGLVLAGPAAWMARRPIVWNVHGIDPSPWLNRIGGRVADAVVVPALGALARMPVLAQAADVVEVRCCAEPGRYAEPRFPRAADPVVLTMGRLHPDKAHDVLLEATHLLRDRVAGLRVRIAGGPQVGYEDRPAELARLARDLGVDDIVEMLGHRDDPAALLAEAAVYVQSSREVTELLPISIFEALSSGVPVVSTRVGAIRDLVEDGRDAILVEPGDPGALADGIATVLLDPARAEAVGRAGAALAEAALSPERMIDSLLAVYVGLAADSGH